MKKVAFLLLLTILPLGRMWADKTGVIKFTSGTDYQILSISPNGKWACGIRQSEAEETGNGFRWNLTTGKVETFSESSEVYKVSNDGVVAGGYYKKVDGKNVEVAALWDNGWTDLEMPSDGASAWAKAITPDGRLVTGCVVDADENYACYVWKADGSICGKMESTGNAIPDCISPDGTMVGGWMSPPNKNRMPVWWNVSTGACIYVDSSILRGAAWCTVRAFTDDSRQLLFWGGYSQDPEHTDLGYGIKSLYNFDTKSYGWIYPIDSTPFNFETFDINGDASMAVGYEQGSDGTALAILWQKETGKCQNLEDWLTAKGADFNGDNIYGVDSSHHYIMRCTTMSNDDKAFGLCYYDADMNLHSMVVLLDQNLEHTAPVNVSASQVSGLTAVSVQWDEPLGDKTNLQGYNIYRDGTKINTSVVSGKTSYNDTSVSIGTHTYAVKAIYSDGESDFSTEVSVTVSERGIQAPVAVMARQRGYDSSLLMWSQPKSNMTPCSYIENGVTMDGFGGGTNSFEAGTLFDAETMSLYRGYALTAVSFVPNSSQGSWVVTVYTHNADGTLKTLASKAVKNSDLTIGEVNTVRLPQQIEIGDGQDMLIGILANVTESSYNVMAVYEDCLKIGKTDLLRKPGETDFYSVNEKGGTTYDMAWATTALMAPVGTTTDVDAIDHYNVYADGTKTGETTDLKYIDSSLSDGHHTLAVDAYYKTGQQSPQVSADVTLAANADVLPSICPVVTTEGQTMTATWTAPVDNDPAVLGYCTDVKGTKSPKTSSSAASFYACTKFEAADHKAYNNYQIQGVTFMPLNNSSFTVGIYQNDEQMAATEVESVTPGEWNTVTFDTPVTINKDDTYSIVIYCCNCPTGEAPLATDANDAENDHSDLYKTSASEDWSSITSFSATGNWMMRLNVADVEGDPFTASYDIVLDKEKAGTQATLTYEKTYSADDQSSHTIQVNTTYTVKGKNVAVTGEPVTFQLTSSGVDEIENGKLKMENSPCYNVLGQRVNGNNTAHGIVITNGSKYINK